MADNNRISHPYIDTVYQHYHRSIATQTKTFKIQKSWYMCTRITKYELRTTTAKWTRKYRPNYYLPIIHHPDTIGYYAATPHKTKTPDDLHIRQTSVFPIISYNSGLREHVYADPWESTRTTDCYRNQMYYDKLESTLTTSSPRHPGTPEQDTN